MSPLSMGKKNATLFLLERGILYNIYFMLPSLKKNYFSFASESVKDIAIHSFEFITSSTIFFNKAAKLNRREKKVFLEVEQYFYLKY